MPTNSQAKTCNTFRSLGASLAFALLFAADTPSANATLLVYEGFDYAPGSSFAGSEGGIGFTQGWASIGGDSGSIGSGSLPSSTVPTSGHAGSASTALLIRPIEEIAGTPGTQSWASFLFSTSVSTVDTGFYAASLTLSPIDGFEGGVSIGAFADDEGNLFLGLGSDYMTPKQMSSIAVVPGETYFLTVSIDWVAGDDAETIRLYLNPVGGAAPAPGDAILTLNQNVASTFSTNTPNRISNIIAAGAVSGEVLFDEIRIGTTFADVVPVPEPSTAGLVAIALGAFARSRRVRRA